MENLQICHAVKEELPKLLEIYESARRFMRKTGNLTQWQGGFPPESLLSSDIDAGQLYTIKNDGMIHGVFALIMGEDPTYSYIEDGSWISDEPYGTLHRVASSGTQKGILQAAVSYSWKKIPHLRIDTHRDNLVMQHAIQKCGFQKCGIIYLKDGSPRIAFEKIRQ